MSFRKIKAKKHDVETITIKIGTFSLECWQYDDCVMFDSKPNGKFLLLRAEAEKLAKWILTAQD